jgi:hypothetical protein
MYLYINISLHVCRCSHLPAAPEHRQCQGTRRRWRPGRGRALKLTRSLAAAPIPSSDGRRAGEPAIADGSADFRSAPDDAPTAAAPAHQSAVSAHGYSGFFLRGLASRVRWHRAAAAVIAQDRRDICPRAGEWWGLTANSWAPVRAGTAWNFALLGLKFPVELCDQPS